MTDHSKERILVADDEPLYLRTTGELLRKAGYECVCVANATEALERLRHEPFDLVLSDLNMPGNLKLELLHEQNQWRSHIPIVVVTGVPTLPTAIESIRLGISDYLLKPIKFDDLLQSVRRAISNAQKTASAEPAESGMPTFRQRYPKLIGRSPPMLELFEVIARVAATDTNVLITGESGTGKELVAQSIHEHSRRNKGKFQVIDCTAVPESLFESMLFGHKKGSFTGAISDAEGLLKQCDGGTAFFDEIGELPAPLQAKLLRVVQEQTFTPVGSHTPVTVDTRFVCATNRNLEMEIKAGRFRQDLYYRLGVIHIELPPLRERGEDVLALADYFLQSLRTTNPSVSRFSEEVLDCLRQYSWPGNIRELRNVVERAVALARCEYIHPADLPQNVRNSSDNAADAPVPNRSHLGPSTEIANASRDEIIEMAEHDYLMNLLRAHAGNVSEAARQAGVSRQGMHKLLKKHNIHAAAFRH